MRLEVQRSKTFTDGAVVNDELIVTENTAYKRDGGNWSSAGITLRERAVPSPKRILRDMRLAECSQAGHDPTKSTGRLPQSTPTAISLTTRGLSPKGESGFPTCSGIASCAEEFQEPAPPANQKIAKAISAHLHLQR